MNIFSVWRERFDDCLNDFSLDKSNILRRHQEARFLSPLFAGSMRFVTTSFATGDPRTETIWSKDVFVYALKNMALTPLMGKTNNDLIHVNQRLTELPGDTIIFKSKFPLSGAGQGDGGTVTGNEESLKRRNMSLVVHERAHGVVSDGPISEQRTDTVIRPEARDDLGDWYSEALENDLITSMAGLYNENSSGAAIETINESYPTSDRIYYGGQSAAGALGNSEVSYATDALLTAGTQASNLMGCNLLSAIRRRALACVPRFRPVNIRDLSKINPDDVRKGVQGPLVGKFFLVLLHPYQIKSIKAETGNATTGAGSWSQLTAAAQVRGNLNPIFSGASFVHDGMIVWEYDRIPMRTGASGTTLAEGFLLNTGRTATSDACANGRTVCRGLLLGAQALCFGWAMRLKWHEDKVDARKAQVIVDCIYGARRTNFNAHGTSTPGSDESIYCMDTEVLVDA